MNIEYQGNFESNIEKEEDIDYIHCILSSQTGRIQTTTILFVQVFLSRKLVLALSSLLGSETMNSRLN